MRMWTVCSPCITCLSAAYWQRPTQGKRAWKTSKAIDSPGPGYYIGYDRAAAAGLPLYLRLLHAVVEQAIDWGCGRLSLGRTTLDPKARLGARPQPLFIWARHRHP